MRKKRKTYTRIYKNNTNKHNTFILLCSTYTLPYKHIIILYIIIVILNIYKRKFNKQKPIHQDN